MHNLYELDKLVIQHNAKQYFFFYKAKSWKMIFLFFIFYDRHGNLKKNVKLCKREIL